MTALKAVVFDAYGTLFDVYSISALADAVCPGRGEALAALWRDKQIEYTRLRTLSGRYADFWAITGDALDYACERLGLALPPAARERLLQQYESLPAHPDALPVLRRLAQMRLAPAILSNGTPRMLAAAVAAAGMENVFDQVLSVDQVKMFKTAPQAYQLAVDALRCQPREILFISSNGWDVCGAAWFGFTTFWLNRAGLPRERLGVEPDAVGGRMDDVLLYLEAGRP
jgi:2-haloacid dehalogenase